MLHLLLTVTAAALVALAAIAGAAWKVLIDKYPGPHIERDYILSVLARESPIFAADRSTRIGAFFGVEHRDYVSLDRIPLDLRRAIVAAEDKYFYRHPGFNPFAISAAIVANLRAGKMVRGGSTITQQTAKNLFKRQGRTLREKLRELANALKLEAHYSKDEILEFYLNQFHVNANGRGVGIAARHFFDKDVAELNLVECAFIAGSVRGPMLYDPFATSDPERRERNLRRANVRKDYVIHRMYEDGYLSKADYEAARAIPVPFQQGQFRFERSIIGDMVQRELASDELSEVLEILGEADLSSSGIQIFTSIDVETQKDALYSLRSQLSRMKLMLEGAAPAGEPPSPPVKIDRSDFLTGTVESLDPEAMEAVIRLGTIRAVLDRDGIAACTEPLKAHRTGNLWARSTDTEIRSWLGSLQPGSTLPVIVRRESITSTNSPLPALADCAYPYTPAEKLQGAIIALDDSFIRAVAGGFHNSDFNRAMDARRQPGSAFKPLVYYAALQLGWSPVDVVKNRREIYRWGQIAYRPKSDHTPPSDEMSLAWVATHSENYGSVWLLSHLTDKLTDAQFAEIAGALGLGRTGNETPRQTANRLRDQHGVIIRRQTVKEAAFENARVELVRENLFSGEAACAGELDRMSYEATSRREIEEAVTARDRETVETRRPERREDVRIAIERFENLESVLRDPSMLPPEWHPLASCPSDIRRRLVEQTDHTAAEWGLPDGYDPAVWRRFRDYRHLVNVSYVVASAKAIGFGSSIEPVLSLPLGTSDVTLSEMAHFYEMAGQGTTRGPVPRLITEIRTSGGEVIWKYEAASEAVEPENLSGAWLETLRNVPVFGTARGADDLVTLSRDSTQPESAIRVPFYGKTGTTNRNQNVYFVGLFPQPESAEGPLSAKRLFTVAAYAGYDDNRPLTRGRIRIYGSSGALPMVIETARGIIDRARYPYDPGDLAVRMTRKLPLSYPGTFATVSINATTGLPDDVQVIQDRTELEVSSHPYLVIPGLITGGRFEPRRLYEPLPVRGYIVDISPEDRAELEKLLSEDLDMRVLPSPAGPAGNPSPETEDREGLEHILEQGLGE